jgi:hypothetical protein
MNQLSPSARRLFELARGQDEPDELARNRVAHALSAKIAADASLLAAGASASTTAAGLGGLGGIGSIAAKSALVVGVTGVLVAAGWLTLRAPRPSEPPVASPGKATLMVKPAIHEAEMPSFQPPAADPTSESGKVAVYRRPARPSAHADSPARVPALEADNGLRAETEALRLAQQALRDKQPEQALRLLDEQDLRFRDGVLPQERAAARVLALCQADRVGEARAQALRFERLWPRSALLGRVRFACWAP